MVRLTPHERGQRRTAEHIVDVPVLQALEEVVEMVKLVPQERVQQRIKVDDTLSSSTNDSTDSAVAVHR